MKVRLLLISMLLGCQLTASGQETCAQKIKDCQAGCTSLSDIKKIIACKNQCPLTACATPPPTPTGTPLKDFDVVVTSLDANRFPLNPKWGGQRDNTLPSPKASCPVDDTHTQDWIASLTCTSFPVTFNGASGVPCGHHVNFLTVTYEGTVTWDGGPTHVYPFGDQDYSLNVTRDDAALYSTAGSEVHIEFDATETVNNWDKTGTWWESFHHDVDSGDDQAKKSIDGRHVIVVGLLGMDTHHDAKTELHPVYAMFVLLNQDRRTRRSSWAFFVRNWGNEGYCGGDQEELWAQPIRVQIPPVPGIVVTQMEVAGMPNVIHRARNTDNDTGMDLSFQPNGAGMLLTFNLLTPDKQSWFVGDVTFQEKVGGPGASEPEEGIPAQFEALRAHVNKLPASVRKQILARQQSVGPTKRGTPLQPTILAEPTQLGNTYLKSPETVVSGSDLIRPAKDTSGEVNRRKQLEVLKKSLTERGTQVDF